MKLCYVAQIGLKLLNSRDLASAFQVAETLDMCHYTWLVIVFYKFVLQFWGLNPGPHIHRQIHAH